MILAGIVWEVWCTALLPKWLRTQPTSQQNWSSPRLGQRRPDLVEFAREVANSGRPRSTSPHNQQARVATIGRLRIQARSSLAPQTMCLHFRASANIMAVAPRSEHDQAADNSSAEEFLHLTEFDKIRPSLAHFRPTMPLTQPMLGNAGRIWPISAGRCSEGGAKHTPLSI